MATLVGKRLTLSFARFMQSGLYAAWEDKDMPFDGYEEDYFEHFDEEHDDYKMFLGDHIDEEGNKVLFLL